MNLSNSIPKLSFNSDYSLWSLQIESLLVSQNLWDDSNNCPTESKQGWTILIQHLNDDILRMVCSLRSPVLIWTKVKAQFETKSFGKLIYVLR